MIVNTHGWFSIRGSHWLSVVLNVTGRKLYGVLAFLGRDCNALMGADLRDEGMSVDAPGS